MENKKRGRGYREKDGWGFRAGQGRVEEAQSSCRFILAIIIIIMFCRVIVQIFFLCKKKKSSERDSGQAVLRVGLRMFVISVVV